MTKITCYDFNIHLNVLGEIMYIRSNCNRLETLLKKIDNCEDLSNYQFNAEFMPFDAIDTRRVTVDYIDKKFTIIKYDNMSVDELIAGKNHNRIAQKFTLTQHHSDILLMKLKSLQCEVNKRKKIYWRE